MEKLNEYFELTRLGFIHSLGERCVFCGMYGYYCTFVEHGVLLAGIVVILDSEVKLFSTYGELLKSLPKEEVFEATSEKV